MVNGLVAAALLAGAIHAPLPLAPISSRDLVELTDLSSIALAPDGRTVVYRAETGSVDRNRYDLVWQVVSVDGSAAPRRLADAGEGDWQNGSLVPDPPQWTADSRWIIYRSVRDGGVQLWRAAADGSRAEPLTHDDGNVRAFVLAADGAGIVYEVGPSRADIARAEQAEYDAGIRIDRRIDPQRPLFRSASIEGRRASDRLRGFWFASGDILADRPPRYRTLLLPSGTVRDATAVEIKLLQEPGGPIDLTQAKLVLSESDAGDRRGKVMVIAAGTNRDLSVVRPSATAPVYCRQRLCVGQRIANVTWLRGADQVLFTTVDTAANQTLSLWNVSTGVVRTLTRSDGTLNGGRDDRKGCAAGRKVVVCVAADANLPPRIVAIDVANRRSRTIADPNLGLARAASPAFVPLRWSDGAGHNFTGQLLLPRDVQHPVPLFLTYYVCDGYLRGGTGDEYPLRQLADGGVASLCINRLPTVPGLGDQVDQYRLALAGIRGAIELLADRGLVDRQRVGMGGLSFGSEVTAWVATQSDLLAATALSSVVMTPTLYWSDAMVGPDVLGILKQVWGLGDPDLEPARWQEISPALNTAAFHAPLLMQMVEQEYHANLELAARLKRNSSAVDLWVYPDEAHVKSQPRHKLAVYERNLDWFRYWLLGAVDPEPSKASQYRVWQEFVRKPGWHDAVPQPLVSVVPSIQPRNQASVSISGNKL